ncbi:MAG: VOC family protein [Eubacteriales bacterium]|nr:VOC family protein [Eubacteriales bacterium]
MKFCHVTLSVRDLDASIRFYTEVVGLPVNKRYPAGPGTEIAFLGGGETQVELICDRDRPAPVAGDGISIGFEVDSVPALFDRLRAAGIAIVSGILAPSPHVRFFFVTDPEDFRVRFLENVQA